MFQHWPWQVNNHVCQYCKMGFYSRTKFETHLLSDKHKKQCLWTQQNNIPKYYVQEFATNWINNAAKKNEIYPEHYHRLSQQIRLTADDIDISRIVRLEYDPTEPDIPRGSNTPVLDEKHGQTASPSLPALPQMISPLQTRVYQPHASHTSAAPAAAGAPPDNFVPSLQSSSPATQAIPHDGFPTMATGNLQSIIRVSNTTMPQPPSPANPIQRNGAGLLAVATSNYQSAMGSSAITVSQAPSPATLTTQSNDGTLHNSTTGTVSSNQAFQPPTVPLNLLMPPPNMPPTAKPTTGLTPLPEPRTSRRFQERPRHNLPSPKRRRSHHAQTSVEMQVKNAPTAFDQNVVIGKAMDTILERLNEIELKLQQKMTKVCQDQTEDIVRQSGNIVEEEIQDASCYAKELITTLQNNLLR